MTSLVLKNLGFRYSPLHPPIFLKLCFSLSSGNYVSVVGDNGTGKSTLGRLICGLLRPTEGSIEIEGISPYDLKAKNRIVYAYYIVQDIQLQFVKTNLYQEIELSYKISGTNRNCISSFSNFYLPDDRSISPFDLSINEAWRFTLFLSMIVNPKVLFIDEIPSPSNEYNTRTLDYLIKKRQNDGMITIISSQDTCDFKFNRHILIHKGEIKVV